MLSELSQVELKPEEHPKILFEKIEAIQCKYAQEYRTADAIATILRAAPREYAGVIASVHINKGSNMTENDLKAAMSLTFRSDIKGMNKGYVDGQSGRQKEVALSNVDGKKETRRCHNCREKGHLAADCTVVIKCEVCGGRHKTIACFEDPRNAHRRPNNWQSKLTEAEKRKHFAGEKTMANIEGDGDKHVQWKEVLLANIDGSKGEKEHLKEPSLWVGPYIQKEWLDEENDSSSGEEYESEDDSDYSSGHECDSKDYSDSVGTVTAEDLLKACTTNLDDMSLNEEELEKAIKEMDEANKKVDVPVWNPPYMGTRSKDKKYLYANPYGMTPEEVKIHNKWSQRKLRDDSKFDEIYEGAERLTETLKQIEKNKEAFAKKYGVEDVDDYFHQKAVAFGWEREVDIHDATNEAEDEEVYFQVKLKNKRGINRLVKIVHKRNKSM
jgi:hypothetical protein